MSRRFFAFGCSYTRYAFPTWADYIGVTFPEYYNYGCGGASNTYIMNKLVEADNLLKFNKNDLVMVMVTGIGRFSFAPKTETGDFTWKTPGDLYENYAATKDPVLKSFVDNMYCDNWALYSSWIALKTIKAFLTAKNVPHKILMSMDNRNYLYQDGSKWGRGDKITLTHLCKEMYATLDVKESLDEWMEKKKFPRSEFVKWSDTDSVDGHPTMQMHYNFLNEKFPEYITEKTKRFYQEAIDTFTNASQHQQGQKYTNELLFRYVKTEQPRLI